MEMLTLLSDQLEALFTEHVDRPLLHSAEGGTWPSALWGALEEFGLKTALLPESSDGAGLTFADVASVFHLLGRHTVPLPLGETMLAAWLLDKAGLAIPAGPLTLADGAGLRLDDGRLSGTLDAVPWASEAAGVVVTVSEGRDSRVCLLKVTPDEITPLSGIARDPRSRIALTSAEPAASGRLALRPGASTLELGAMLRASQMAGALHCVLDLCIDYANTRRQFGRPIGKFQAMQQLLAQLAAEVAASEVAAATAWRELDTGDAGIAVAVAKVRCSDAARTGAAIAHQVHGAIGVTDEHILHYFTRRLWSWRREFGTAEIWAEQLGHSVLQNSGGELWPMLTSATAA